QKINGVLRLRKIRAPRRHRLRNGLADGVDCVARRGSGIAVWGDDRIGMGRRGPLQATTLRSSLRLEWSSDLPERGTASVCADDRAADGGTSEISSPAKSSRAVRG